MQSSSCDLSVTSGQQTTVQLVVTPTTADIGEDVTFDASASIAGEGKQIVSFDFDFGDGTTETRSVADFGEQAGIVTHAYDEAGNYSPIVSVTDSSNAKKSASVNVKVSGPDTPEEPPVVSSSGGGGSAGWLALLVLAGSSLLRRQRKS